MLHVQCVRNMKSPRAANALVKHHDGGGCIVGTEAIAVLLAAEDAGEIVEQALQARALREAERCECARLQVRPEGRQGSRRLRPAKLVDWYQNVPDTSQALSF